MISLNISQALSALSRIPDAGYGPETSHGLAMGVYGKNKRLLANGWFIAPFTVSWLDRYKKGCRRTITASPKVVVTRLIFRLSATLKIASEHGLKNPQSDTKGKPTASEGTL